MAIPRPGAPEDIANAACFLASDEASFVSGHALVVDGALTAGGWMNPEFAPSMLVADYGVVVIPMYDFYPEDVHGRNTRAGFDQVRLSFCFNEAKGQQRRDDLKDAVAAFCNAALAVSGK